MVVRRKIGRITGEGRSRKGRGVGGNFAGKESTAIAVMRGRDLRGRAGAEVERECRKNPARTSDSRERPLTKQMLKLILEQTKQFNFK